MNLKDRIAVFDRDSKLLQEITSSYPRGSEHHEALQRATSALWYVLRGGHDFQTEASPAAMMPKKHSAAEGAKSASLNRSA
jgi:hypothetical protein